MLKRRVIPTLLLSGPGLVKGKQFNSWRRIGPLLQAVRVYESRQVDELILLDIAATPEGRGPDFRAIEDAAGELFAPLTVGGGVRTIEDIRQLLRCGADKVAICTAALERPEFIDEASDKFGAQAIVVAIDTKGGRVWSRCARVQHDVGPAEWAKDVVYRGAGEILLNAVDRDGVFDGYDIRTIERVSGVVSVPVIASGGCGTYEHMAEALNAGASAVAAASIFHFTDATPAGARRYLRSQGFPVRADLAYEGRTAQRAGSVAPRAVR